MRIFPRKSGTSDRMYNGRWSATTEAYARINQFEMAAGRFLRDGEDATMRRRQRCATWWCSVPAWPRSCSPSRTPSGRPSSSTSPSTSSSASSRTASPGDHRRQVGGGLQQGRLHADSRPAGSASANAVILRQGGSILREQVELHQITLTISDIDKVRSTGKLVSDMLERGHHPKGLERGGAAGPAGAGGGARDRYNMLLMLIASHLAGGRRHRHHEHHAGDRDGTDPRDRHPPRPGRQTPRHHHAVHHRGRGANHHRRPAGGRDRIGMVVRRPAHRQVLLDQQPLPAKIDVLSIFLSLGVAVSVGVLFGWYPARRASLLDPIEALRHN